MDDLPDDILYHIFKHGCILHPYENILLWKATPGPHPYPFAQLVRCICRRWYQLIENTEKSPDFWFSVMRLQLADAAPWTRARLDDPIFDSPEWLATQVSRPSDIHAVFDITNTESAAFSFYRLVKDGGPRMVDQPFQHKHEIVIHKLMKSALALIPHAGRLRSLQIKSPNDVLVKFVHPFIAAIVPSAPRLEVLHVTVVELIGSNNDFYGSLAASTFDILDEPVDGLYHLPAVDALECSYFGSVSQLQLWNTTSFTFHSPAGVLQNIALESSNHVLVWRSIFDLICSCQGLQRLWLRFSELDVDSLPLSPPLNPVTSHIWSLDVLDFANADVFAIALFVVFSFPLLEKIRFKNSDYSRIYSDRGISMFPPGPLTPLTSTTQIKLAMQSPQLISLIGRLQLPSLKFFEVQDLPFAPELLRVKVNNAQSIEALILPQLSISFSSFSFLTSIFSSFTFEHLATLRLDSVSKVGMSKGSLQSIEGIYRMPMLEKLDIKGMEALQFAFVSLQLPRLKDIELHSIRGNDSETPDCMSGFDQLVETIILGRPDARHGINKVLARFSNAKDLSISLDKSVADPVGFLELLFIDNEQVALPASLCKVTLEHAEYSSDIRECVAMIESFRETRELPALHFEFSSDRSRVPAFDDLSSLRYLFND
ncbi:hypothetical protein C8J56DRAFT_881123 [Mycena floridula]|nr:hypothetical protein C8J56DRAFT_881123 [Mycena floridula]